MNTGTRTQVANTAMAGSRIFFVSCTIFHSSFVEPSSMNTSMCGMQLKAISFVNCSGLLGSFTKLALVWPNSSSMPSLPAPDTDW